MNTRVEPTLGSVNDLDLDGGMDLMRQVHQAINGHAAVAAEDAEAARKRGLPDHILKAEEELRVALERARQASEVLAQAYSAHATQLTGAEHYLAGRPVQGAATMSKAADAWRQVKDRAVDMCYGLSDIPGHAWDRIAKRVNNAITQGVEQLGSNVAARQEKIKAWATRVDLALGHTIGVIEGIPDQVAAYAHAKKLDIKRAGVAVITRVLQWGARKEDALREKITHAASLGEAFLKTGADVGRGVVDQVRQAGKTFSDNVEAARNRRQP